MLYPDTCNPGIVWPWEKGNNCNIAVIIQYPQTAKFLSRSVFQLISAMGSIKNDRICRSYCTMAAPCILRGLFVIEGCIDCSIDTKLLKASLNLKSLWCMIVFWSLRMLLNLDPTSKYLIQPWVGLRLSWIHWKNSVCWRFTSNIKRSDNTISFSCKSCCSKLWILVSYLLFTRKIQQIEYSC